MYRSDLIDDYEMVPFELPNCVYMPREIDPIVEELYIKDMTRGEEEVEAEAEAESRQKNNHNDYYDNFCSNCNHGPKGKMGDVNRICRNIERDNPEIFRIMMRYGIPYPVAVRLCRRIVRITLSYC